MNVYDSGRMIDVLASLGFSVTEDPAQADLAILNTCHIREKAEQKVFSDLGRLREHKENRKSNQQEMIIAVAGCVAQGEGAEIMRQAPYVNMVFGPQTYHRLPEMLAQALRSVDSHKKQGRGVIDIEFPLEPKFDSLPETQRSQVSAFLSVQEGCDKFCTFCVVPYTRGAEFSRPVVDVIKEARHLVNLGAKEITLLGQNVNAYHGAAIHGQGEWGLGRLIRELAEIEGLKRLRYTTSHPLDMDQELIEAHRDVPQLMPFLHLPVQSGSDRILEAMNRKHTTKYYKEVIDQLRQACPQIALSSDFIVGFPGEADADFQETLTLIECVGYAQAYSFKYSIRPGTPGALMDNQVDETVKASRLQVLQDLINRQQLAFNESIVGTVQSVLLDRRGKREGQFMGRSPYMQSVTVFAEEPSLGEIVNVFIEEAHPNSLAGHLCNSDVMITAIPSVESKGQRVY